MEKVLVVEKNVKWVGIDKDRDKYEITVDVLENTRVRTQRLLVKDTHIAHLHVNDIYAGTLFGGWCKANVKQLKIIHNESDKALDIYIQV